MATGVGVLIAAFCTINTLSVYHYQVAVYLAWMSSNTHLTAVSLLQKEFRENKEKVVTRRLRLGAMAFLGLLLLVALVPTASYNWAAIITRNQQKGHAYAVFHKTAVSSASMPARCFWLRQYSGGLTPDAAWSFIILVLSYLWKGSLLFRPTQHFLKVTCRRVILGPLQKRLDQIVASLLRGGSKARLRVTLHYKFVLSIYVVVWALFELAQSFVTSLWICGGGLLWGSLQIMIPRHFLPSDMQDTESAWTFGQVLPIMLLAIPILSFTDGYITQKAISGRNPQPDESVVDPEPDRCYAEEHDATTHGAAEPNARRSVAQRRLFSGRSRSRVGPNEDSDSNIDSHQRTLPRPHPPWKCNRRLYNSRFIIAAFWGSQLGILALGVILVLFYFQLSVPIEVSDLLKLQATIATDYGIWFLVGCAVVGWLGTAVILLLLGACFSSVFRMET
ncbi:MAG: hypothetical protein Q9222_006386 [Ikaeria aurantiellina]